MDNPHTRKAGKAQLEIIFGQKNEQTKIKDCVPDRWPREYLYGGGWNSRREDAIRERKLRLGG